jgi:hypothetical protein
MTTDSSGAAVSADLVRLALDAYDVGAARAGRHAAPDLDTAVVCHAGRRRLAALAEADPWMVDAATAAAARQLIASIPDVANLSAADIVAWVDMFPRAIAGVLDRRVRPMAYQPGGRRAADRRTDQVTTAWSAV